VRKFVDVISKTGEVLVTGALCYIATDSPANANWLGPAPLPAIAAQVSEAVAAQAADRDRGAGGECLKPARFGGVAPWWCCDKV
jgi:hypothetical protein